jgi:hypothetical protein
MELLMRFEGDHLEAEIAFHGWIVAEAIDDLGQVGTTLERPGRDCCVRRGRD